MGFRPITAADLPALAAVAATDETAFTGRPSRLGLEDVASWVLMTDLEHDSWVHEADGEAVAFGWLSAEETLGTFAGVVAQGWKGRGLGTEIVRQAEERARARGLTRLHTFGLPADAAAAELFARHGFAEVRRFFDMAIELTEAPPEPTLPPGLVLEEAREQDARGFHQALDESFRDHWEWHSIPYEEWWELRRGQQRDGEGPLWFLVRDGDEITAVVRNEARRNGGGFVGALGVRRPWRGKGLAKALLLRTFAEFHRRGEKRVTLGVDAESPTGATHLYESVGMHVESELVVHEKDLR